ncbi:MAG: hypothetical protein EHM56_06260 [Chloroflexi bacterium]|nr:MAG: hypothetical protein EHM56_06260 [Chloroflexota bacterium]
MTRERRLRTIQNQIRRLEEQSRGLQALADRYAWLRLAVAAAGLALSVTAFLTVGTWLPVACLAAALLAFGVAVWQHRRVEEGIARRRILRRLEEEQVARGTLDWEAMPATFPQTPRPEHPFEADLDLAGPRSLHRLLDRATTHGGSSRLRDWLAEPEPDLGEIKRRKALVRELAPRFLLRDRLALNAILAARGYRTWRAENLLAWLAEHPPEVTLRRWLAMLAGLAGLNALLLIANRLGLLPPWWQLTFAVYLVLWLARSRLATAASNEAGALQGAFQQLRAALRQLERFSYRGTPSLQELCAPFLDRTHRPSAYLGGINRVLGAIGLRTNPLLGFLLNAVVPWDFFFAHRLARLKIELARRAPAWLEIWFELEALGSLANLAYLHPEYTMPVLREGGEDGRPAFAARGLGHPLLPASKVRNDFVAELGQVGILTGSNMAGKSVFMKTVGANLALAQAGGPVDALALETLPFRLFTSMSIVDSVTAGISYFYAEVRRLKSLLSELERSSPLPLFYFVDEILRGTNNQERRIGSRAYVRALAGSRGSGLIATHDLELARLAEEMPQVRNLHFRDHVEGNRMVFDYILRPGPSPTTNALRIMELEGLPVAED